MLPRQKYEATQRDLVKRQLRAGQLAAERLEGELGQWMAKRRDAEHAVRHSALGCGFRYGWCQVQLQIDESCQLNDQVHSMYAQLVRNRS